MSSAAPSAEAAARVPSATRSGTGATLSGPVSVCVDRPLLGLDRAFTYELPEELGAGVGSVVRVPFHGRLIRAWVLGPTDDVPARMLGVRNRVSANRAFDEPMLALFRWMSERYVAPLATVIARASPPRVASEEGAADGDGRFRRMRPDRRVGRSHTTGDGLLERYRSGDELGRALRDGSGTFVVRPAPAQEADVALACVDVALAAGRTAIVIVPEADPLPATAARIAERYGDDVLLFIGGGRRARYRMWLDVAAGRYRVVVGTRPAVFAPLADLGLVYVHRESHAQHREERSPRYHVRDVARARAELEEAVCALSAFCPTVEAAALDHVEVEPSGRPWAPVEVVKPGPEGRSPRLVRALRDASSAFVYEPRRGYGVARVCRACGEPAACASCLGTLRLQKGAIRCVVCEAPGRCAACGAADFGIARGGAERVEEWARSIASLPVSLLASGDRPRPPREREVTIGGVDALKDVGALELDLVAILNADASLRRPGLSARERALVAWFEAAAWARADGRVILQTTAPNDPAVQALVTGRPERFRRAEAPRRAEAGFPIGAAVFRVAGTAELEAELERLPHRTLLASSAQGATICLVALDPGDLPAFGEQIRRLAVGGVVTRVEAEPHL